MIKEKNKEGLKALFIDRSQTARTPLTQGKNNEKFEPFKYTWVTPANAGNKKIKNKTAPSNALGSPPQMRGKSMLIYYLRFEKKSKYELRYIFGFIPHSHL